MKSGCAEDKGLFARQKRVGRRQMRITRRLLVILALLAALVVIALGLALREAHALARATQFNDLWYVASVNNELAEVSHRAMRAHAHLDLAGRLPDEELDGVSTSLELLYSVLDVAPDTPKVQTRVRHHFSDTAHAMDELARLVDRWSQQLTDARAADDVMMLRAMLAHANEELPAFRIQLQRALSDVHVAGYSEAERSRRQLLWSFSALSTLLVMMLCGVAAAIGRAFRDRRIAIDTSRALHEVNQSLEWRVTERTRQIDAAHDLLTFILDASPTDVVLLDAENGRVHYINQRLRERLVGRRQPMTLFLEDLLLDPKACTELRAALDESGHLDGVQALIASAPPYWSSLSARLIELEGRVCHLIWGFDISEHKKLEHELRRLATTDSLTGLMNRGAFMEKAETLVEQCRRQRSPCGAVMIDIDHFKSINDRHGHQAGDIAIRATGRAIAQALREADLVGRLGGEEFAVVLPNTDAQGTQDTADRIRHAVELMQTTLENGVRLQWTVSVGFAALRPGTQSLEGMLVDADAALYRAKAQGRNRVMAFSEEPVA